MKYAGLLLFFLPLLIISCEKEEDRAAIENKALATGHMISDSAQSLLASNLKKAIMESGPFEAVAYCNKKAMPLTRSMEEKYGARIKRTSLKVRNPEDRPDEKESEILQYYDSLARAGAPLQDRVEWLDDEHLLYTRPIMINNGLCLTCHGEVGVTVSDSLYDFIKSKYPDDQATGYRLNDFRGIWSIVFEEDRLEESNED